MNPRTLNSPYLWPQYFFLSFMQKWRAFQHYFTFYFYAEILFINKRPILLKEIVFLHQERNFCQNVCIYFQFNGARFWQIAKFHDRAKWRGWHSNRFFHFFHTCKTFPRFIDTEWEMISYLITLHLFKCSSLQVKVE